MVYLCTESRTQYEYGLKLEEVQLEPWNNCWRLLDVQHSPRFMACKLEEQKFGSAFTGAWIFHLKGQCHQIFS